MLLTLASVLVALPALLAPAVADLPGRRSTSTITDRPDQAASGSQFITGSDGWGFSTHPKRAYCGDCHGGEALRERVPADRGTSRANPTTAPGRGAVPVEC